MTSQGDVETSDLFGLAGTFPRPGWVVLDAARSHRFTGELSFETIPSAKVYLDSGEIYLAERATDPSLGSRLVEAGALNAAQLEHGSVFVGEVAHLGRLFERVPPVNRHTVLVVTEIMTEECVGWVAGQLVGDVVVVPYRYHPAGIRRWLRPTPARGLTRGDPLPSPAIDEAPVELVRAEPLCSAGGSFDDGMIQGDQPSWLDEQPSGTPRHELIDDVDVVAEGDVESGVAPAAPASGAPAAALADPPVANDAWLTAPPLATDQVFPEPVVASDDDQTKTGPELDDGVARFDSDGLPEAGTELLMTPERLTSPSAVPLDRFEVIWPSGEVDEQFDASDTATTTDRPPDLDRAGPAARLTTNAADVADSTAATLEQPVKHTEIGTSDVELGDEVTDEVVLAVRRAVATIETDSLAARRRLVTAPQFEDPSRGVGRGAEPVLMPPRPDTSSVENVLTPVADSARRTPTRSVSDDDLPAAAPVPEITTSGATAPAVGADGGRTGALRRLIGTLRRR